MKKIVTMVAVSAVAGLAANASDLFLGTTGSIEGFTYNNVASGHTAAQDYSQNGASSFAGGAVAMASDSTGGIYVMQTGGLAHYDWNGSAFTGSGSTVQAGTAVKVGSDGTVFATYSDGLRAFTYDAGADSFTENSLAGFAGARDLAVAPDGTIHVLHDGGLSAFTWNGSTLTAVAGGFHGGVTDGTSIVIGDDGTIFAARTPGINAFTFNGSNYVDAGPDAPGSWWGVGTTDLALSSDGTLFATMTGDGQLNSVTFDSTTGFTQTGYMGMAGASTVFVDSEDNIHLGKGDGILEILYDDTQAMGSAITFGDWHGSSNVTAITEVIPEPATIGLLGLGGLVALWIRRQRMY